MRKRFLTLTAAALVLGMMALSAGAQTQAPGASNLQGRPILYSAGEGGRLQWQVGSVVRARLDSPVCWRGPWGRLHCRCVRCW